jgi:hypothetical protein
LPDAAFFAGAAFFADVAAFVGVDFFVAVFFAVVFFAGAVFLGDAAAFVGVDLFTADLFADFFAGAAFVAVDFFVADFFAGAAFFADRAFDVDADFFVAAVFEGAASPAAASDPRPTTRRATAPARPANDLLPVFAICAPLRITAIRTPVCPVVVVARLSNSREDMRPDVTQTTRTADPKGGNTGRCPASPSGRLVLRADADGTSSP